MSVLSLTSSPVPDPCCVPLCHCRCEAKLFDDLHAERKPLLQTLMNIGDFTREGSRGSGRGRREDRPNSQSPKSFCGTSPPGIDSHYSTNEALRFLSFVSPAPTLPQCLFCASLLPPLESTDPNNISLTSGRAVSSSPHGPCPIPRQPTTWAVRSWSGKVIVQVASSANK